MSNNSDAYYAYQLERLKKADREDEASKVLSKGQLKSARIDLGMKSGLVSANIIMKQMAINRQRKAMEQQAKALTKPVLTDKALAMQASIQDSAMRQARAGAHRGTGGAGIDEYRMRAAQDLAMKKGAQALTAYQGGELGRRKVISDNLENDADNLMAMRSDRDDSIVKTAGKLITDKDVVKAFGKAGLSDREKKALAAKEA